PQQALGFLEDASVKRLTGTKQQLLPNRGVMCRDVQPIDDPIRGRQRQRALEYIIDLNVYTTDACATFLEFHIGRQGGGGDRLCDQKCELCVFASRQGRADQRRRHGGDRKSVV